MVTLSVVAWVFIAIIALFYSGLIIKPRIKLNLCMICLAVSLTWISLLVLRQLGLFDNDVLIALLLGQSVVGGYYLWERRVKDVWLLFRLPVLLSLSLAAWTLLTLSLDLPLIGIVLVVWLLHGLLYTYRNKPATKAYVDKIIACCSKW